MSWKPDFGRNFTTTITITSMTMITTTITSMTMITITRREVDELEARLWAELHGFNYFATSAASGTGVTDMFQAMIIMITMIIIDASS